MPNTPFARSVRPRARTAFAHRPVLAMGAMACTLSLAGLPALPASAELLQEEAAKVIDVQEYQANWYPEVAASRDGYDITAYTVVQWPVPAGTTISSFYGYRGGEGVPSDHGGIDLNPGAGYPIQSIAEGVVVVASSGGGSAYGVHVVIEHTVDGRSVRTLYGHMEYGSLAVGLGQTVTRGQLLGTVGSTGLSTGPHLHFEVHVDGVEVDPLAWLQEHANS